MLENLQALLSKWQRILRLQDWDIRVQLVETPWRKTGDIKIDAHDRKAIVLFNAQNPHDENLEEVMHLKLWPLDSMLENLLGGVFGNDANDPKYKFAYAQFMDALEPTVEDLTKSLLQLGGNTRVASFSRVQTQVKKELGL